MKNFKLTILLFLWPLSILAQEKFKGTDFPYDWQKNDQNFFIQKNSISTVDSLINYEAYYFEHDPFYRFVWISEFKNGKTITVLQWIDDEERGHFFRLARKKSLLIFTQKHWAEEPVLQGSDYARLFGLISEDLSKQKTREEVISKEMNRQQDETPVLLLALGCTIVLWILLKKHTRATSQSH